MSIDITEYLNSTYSSAVSSTTSTDDTTEAEETQDMFLTILLAQLEYQDPLDPVSDTEMVTQLAQISTLEEMAEMNESMGDVVDSLSTLTVNSAVNYIGMEATASGNTFVKDDEGSSTVYYTLSDDATSVTAHIYDEEGNLYDSVDLGAHDAGEYEFEWDGETYSGSEADDGTYYVAFEAYDENGEYLTATTEVAGTIVGITAENGSSQFVLDDGRLVDLLSITSLNTAGSSGESSSDESSDS